MFVNENLDFFLKKNVEYENKVNRIFIFIINFIFISSFILTIYLINNNNKEVDYCYYYLLVLLLNIILVFFIGIPILFCYLFFDIYFTYYLFIKCFFPKVIRKLNEIINFIIILYKFFLKKFVKNYNKEIELKKITICFILKRIFFYFYILSFFKFFKKILKLICLIFKFLRDSFIVLWFFKYNKEEYDSEIESFSRSKPLPGDIPLHEWFDFENRNYLFVWSRMFLIYNVPDIGIARFLKDSEKKKYIGCFLDEKENLLKKWTSVDNFSLSIYDIDEEKNYKTLYETLPRRHFKYICYYKYPIYYTHKANKLKNNRGMVDLLKTHNSQYNGLYFFSRKKKYNYKIIKLNRFFLKNLRACPIIIPVWVKHIWYRQCHVDDDDPDICLLYFFWMWLLERNRNYNPNIIWKNFKKGKLKYDNSKSII